MTDDVQQWVLNVALVDVPNWRCDPQLTDYLVGIEPQSRSLKIFEMWDALPVVVSTVMIVADFKNAAHPYPYSHSHHHHRHCDHEHHHSTTPLFHHSIHSITPFILTFHYFHHSSYSMIPIRSINAISHNFIILFHSVHSIILLTPSFHHSIYFCTFHHFIHLITRDHSVYFIIRSIPSFNI